MNEDTPVYNTEVIIVGAGPTGLSLAAELLRYGIDFIILEKNEKATLLSKAVVVQARTLEIFDELGLADKAIAEGRMTTAFNVFYKGQHKVALNLAGLGAGLSKYPFAPGSSECKQLGSTKLTVVMHSFTEIPGKIFGSETDFYILLRPDNHISYIGKEVAVCQTFMKTILTS